MDKKTIQSFIDYWIERETGKVLNLKCACGYLAVELIARQTMGLKIEWNAAGTDLDYTIFCELCQKDEPDRVGDGRK